MISLKSKISQKVLGYFLLNDNAELYLNEMVKKFKVDRGNLVKKLKEWEKEDLLLKRKRGNLSLYKINPSYPFLAEIRGLAQKSFGLEVELKKTLLKINGLKEAYIFGSYAKNALTADSDVDLLLVGEHSSPEVSRHTAALQKKFDREINVADYGTKEFKAKKGKDDFLKTIFKNPTIKLI